jgi:hypothetical protein
MADRITFSKKINDSVQVGDELYYSVISGTTAGSETSLGTITAIGEKYVEVASAGSAAIGNFFSFRKPMHADASLPNGGYTNTSSLKGYHAEVEFTNPSTSKQELFAVGSEVTMSSK